jgi:hypothetical protein
MRQIAPEPVALSELVESLKYKKGWGFFVDDIDRGQDSEGLTLVIQITAPNTYPPHETMRVNHYMIVPPAAFDKRAWQRWLFDQILLVEQHEAAEFFQVDGVRPYAPNHAPGNNPYTIFDQGTPEGATTNYKGERFEA